MAGEVPSFFFREEKLQQEIEQEKHAYPELNLHAAGFICSQINHEVSSRTLFSRFFDQWSNQNQTKHNTFSTASQVWRFHLYSAILGCILKKTEDFLCKTIIKRR